jgi:hypothetical protein
MFPNPFLQKMLRLIKDRIAKKQRCDDILEVAWSAMWNVFIPMSPLINYFFADPFLQKITFPLIK